MEGLPLVPGYSFSNPTVTEFKLSHKFDFRNGFALPTGNAKGIGELRRDVDSIRYDTVCETVRFDPTLTYGRVKGYPPGICPPHWVLYDKKALTYKAFFKQSIFESPLENHRIRHVNIIYFLEDDTISVMEPPVQNSGIVQGRLVRRGRIPKTHLGDYWSWKDFNIGQNVALNGIVFHICDVDNFTREYLESQGIVLNAKEDIPPDPYTTQMKLQSTPMCHKSGNVDDKLRRMLEYDNKVLKFEAVHDERETSLDGSRKFYSIYYFLCDDCIQIKLHETDQEPSRILVKKIKLPKRWTDIPVDFPSGVLEAKDAEIVEYISPKDLMVGQTIPMLARRFYLYDCDRFTRNYYKICFNVDQPARIEVHDKKGATRQRIYPPHNGFGSVYDSLQNCISLIPKPPKKDIVRFVTNMSKYLRYEARMQWVHPEDEIRRFVISYSLSNAQIKIIEPPIRNSGIKGGMFLASIAVPKPHTDPDDPEHYSPADFWIGAVIQVFNHRFIITGADLYVFRYMEDNQDKFTPEARDNLRNYFMSKGMLKDELDIRIAEMEDDEDVGMEKNECHYDKAGGGPPDVPVDENRCSEAAAAARDAPDPYVKD